SGVPHAANVSWPWGLRGPPNAAVPVPNTCGPRIGNSSRPNEKVTGAGGPATPPTDTLKADSPVDWTFPPARPAPTTLCSISGTTEGTLQEPTTAPSLTRVRVTVTGTGVGPWTRYSSVGGVSES